MNPASTKSDDAVQRAMDPIAAVATSAGAAYTGDHRHAITEASLRSSLPDLGSDPDESLLKIAFEMAGVAGRWRTVEAEKLRDGDCPFVVVSMANGAVEWHVITSVAHAGLATQRLRDGSLAPIALGQLATGKTLRGWSVSVLDGPKRSESNRVSSASRLKASFWPAKRILPPLILATFAINILALAIPLATMNIFDRVISNAAFETLWMLAAGVVMALLFDFALRSLRASVLDRSSARADVLATNGVFGRILGARMKARRMGVGAQVNGLRELDTVREYFNASAIATLGDLPFVALYLLVIYLVAGSLVVVPLIAVPLFLITALLIQLRLRRIVEGAFNDTAHKNAVATEILSGMESVKLAGGERWAAGRWEKAVASQLNHSLAVRFWTNLSLHLITFFQGAVTISLLVIGVYAVTAGDITPGALFAANLLASRCLAPLVAVSALVARWTQVKMARDVVNQLATMESERPTERKLVIPTAPVRGLKLNDVAFAYSEDAPTVLNGASLSISSGERIAVIGGIGSGKSTLMRLLSGLEMPTAGQVLVDGLSSTDMDLDAWRGLIGVSPQSPAFFAGTVREAVAIGRETDDAAIIKALKLAGADVWVATTGMGLDTPIGERGAGLSGGQLQTLAIARAVLGNPELLLLDEPTSHMDGRSEAAFAARLQALPHRPTTITVTHRPAMIDAAERLIVMERGSIILDGPRADVLKQLQQVVKTRTTASVKVQAA
ncbi:ATP-binding cassette domain-containing protein [Ahrensia sp. R2A130]|uniref:ATP-binding cassette domain-containing protein n=1 Tax=Ahrensia sp. R2A130 TaxID=744979 RepID=UPI0001E0E904|nr:ATP-binding cassette domain-containing protein [Ahrensia sp. R2A130]EFL87467.1 toxin secretion ATP-binding protein [Ahrensia sp. R2A130]